MQLADVLLLTAGCKGCHAGIAAAADGDCSAGSFIFSGTIEENLRYGNEDASDEQLKRAASSVRIDKFVSQFAGGLSDAGRGTGL